MIDPNSVTAHFGQASFPGRLTRLEGGGGYMRVRLDWKTAPFEPVSGAEGELEMHDGGRFRVRIVEPLSLEPEGGSGEVRMKLTGRGG